MLPLLVLVSFHDVAAEGDTAGPVIQEITPSDGMVLGKGSVTFSVKAYDEHPNQLILMFGEAAAGVIPPTETNGVVNEPTNMNASLTIDTNNFSDGIYILKVQASDLSGNVSERTVHYIIDKEVPSTPIGGAPHNELHAARSTLFSWSEAIDASRVVYELRGSHDKTQLEGVGSADVRFINGLAESKVSIADLPEGMWYWQVRAVDQAGNEGSWSDVWQVNLDGTPPALAVDTPSNELLIGTTSLTLNVGASASDANGLGVYAVLLDGAEKASITSPPNGSMPGVQLDFTDYVDGVHTILIRVRDKAGNISEQERTVILDKIPPVLTTDIVDSQIIQGRVLFSVNATDARAGNYTMTVRNEHGAVVYSDDKGLVGATALLAYEWDTTTVADGEYHVDFQGVDIAGNEATVTRTVHVKNTHVGSGGVQGTIETVPLLRELSVELAQPRLIGSVTDRSLNDSIVDIPPSSSDVSDLPVVEDAATKGVMVAEPTESGWRFFGILWYWWILGAGAGAAGWQAVRMARKRTQDLA